MRTETGILILKNETPEDVARAMIESGYQKEPFYVFDMDEAHRRIQHFKKVMPRVQIFYATNSNSTDRMLKLAAAHGLGFVCVSPGDISQVMKLNISPLSIVFAMSAKSHYWITYAQKSGVRHTTFDSSCELTKIKQYWPDARLLIRIKVDDEQNLDKITEKFGCDFETEAKDLLEKAAALGLKVVGVAFQVGSACFSSTSHSDGLKKAKALFDYEAKAGRGMHIVDIGGGFMSDRINSIDQTAINVNSTLEELFPDPDVQIIAEPGRYICESSYVLYCSVNNVRKAVRNGEIYNMVHLNDGVFGTLKFNHTWHTVKRFERDSKITNEKHEKTMLWGPSCHIDDCVMKGANVLLPQCTPCDWLVFPRKGAYTFTFAGTFSCIGNPQIRSVISEKLWEKIKDSYSDDFIRADVSSPLPTTLPPITKSADIIESDSVLKV